jgi:hypothetical protein
MLSILQQFIDLLIEHLGRVVDRDLNTANFSDCVSKLIYIN